MTTPDTSQPSSPLSSAASSVRGRFLWYDLMTTDPDAAVRFYAEVCGWGTQVWETAGMPPYTMFTAAGIPIGGVLEMPAALQGTPPHWIAYVGTPDVDATVREAEARGGSVHKAPTDIPEVGRFAVITDPQGAAIAVFTPASEAAEAPGVPPRGHFSWHELATTDHRAAFAFYSALFGWEKMSEFDMGPMGMYVLYGRNGQQLGGMFDKSPEMPAEPYWLYYAHVDGADAAAERVKAAGGKVLTGPMEVPGGDRVAVCMDPQGGAFAVHSVRA